VNSDQSQLAVFVLKQYQSSFTAFLNPDAIGIRGLAGQSSPG